MSFPSDAELNDIVRRIVRQALQGSPPAEEPSAVDDAFTPPPERDHSGQAGSSPAGPPAEPAEAARVVALGADHGGYLLKERLKVFLAERGYNLVDCGTHSEDSVDYPDFASAVARLVSGAEAWRGIIIDGAGIGSCMVANKFPGVRAALCYDHATALNSREHNDANVLTLGSGLIGVNLACQIAQTWLETPFGGGRHARRVDKIKALDKNLRD